MVTYGGHGGSQCAKKLKVVLSGGFKMRLAAATPALTLPRGVVTSKIWRTNAAAAFAAADTKAVGSMAHDTFMLGQASESAKA